MPDFPDKDAIYGNFVETQTVELFVAFHGGTWVSGEVAFSGLYGEVIPYEEFLQDINSEIHYSLPEPDYFARHPTPFQLFSFFRAQLTLLSERTYRQSIGEPGMVVIAGQERDHAIDLFRQMLLQEELHDPKSKERVGI